MPNHGQGGRRRQPPHLHVVKGTHRADRHGAAPVLAPAKILPKAPAHLTERAAEIFADLVTILDGQGIASADHTHMLAMAATALWEWERHEDVLESVGWTFTTVSMTGSTTYKLRPEVAARNMAMKRAESLLSRFGLSPADAGRVSLKAPPDANPFAAVG